MPFDKISGPSRKLVVSLDMTTVQREDRLLKRRLAPRKLYSKSYLFGCTGGCQTICERVRRKSPFGYLAMACSKACISSKLELVDPGDVAAGNSGNTDKPFG
jgi:hypothetical protein